ncbi:MULTISPECIES: hypothetical protein [Streptomyces]|uniref:Uncharacterized protein n=1 Tax=Streptomyces liliiviolaceus TaxID=2823109 RepID=A0A940XP83_9ACTN|nr:hypothetical protein [Streptomyces liliiviolaceus]MBQ0847711.1 hypothetical protein [Streptomyces liliiviolaceus]
MTGAWRPQPPPAADLTGWQYLGWRCCWCAGLLERDARSAGRAEGHCGAHDLSVEVYECGPQCPKRPVETGPA